MYICFCHGSPKKKPIIRLCHNSKGDKHLQLKCPKGLNHVAEYKEKVAHAQGAQQRVEQGRHRPEEKLKRHPRKNIPAHLLHFYFMLMKMVVKTYFVDRQKMLRTLPAKPTAPKMIMKTPTIQNLSEELINWFHPEV